MAERNEGGKAKGAKERLEFLDGLRGLAAFYVVFHHAYLQSLTYVNRAPVEHLAPAWTQWTHFGHQAVAVFIILSGYLLMLPAARSKDGQLRGGFWGYIKRRAWRIVPPYYAALALTLFLIFVVPGLNWQAGVHWDASLPALKADVILSHVLLVHNLRPRWIYGINHPFWSVATEWQIYFIFALVLLPLWRRFGVWLPIVVGFLMGLLPVWLLSNYFYDPSFWFVGLFAMGMGGAVVNFSERPEIVRWRDRLPWAWLSALSAVAFGVLAFSLPPERWNWTATIWADVLAGCATVGFIIHSVRAVRQGKTPLLAHLLQTKPMRTLGAFSYSLYLTHAVVLAILHIYLRGKGLPPVVTMGWMFVLGAPLSLVAAYLFYLGCERPFIKERKATPKPAPPAEPASVPSA